MLNLDNKFIEDNYENILNYIQLYKNKLKDIKYKYRNILITCPNPEHKDGQENRPSCVINIDKDKEDFYGHYHCFTCGCKGNFYQLLTLCFQNETLLDNWLKNNFNLQTNQLNLPDFSCFYKNKNKNKILDENILNNFNNYHPYMEKRKITKEVAEKFKIKYDSKSNCIIFPTWDENNNLIMLTKRNIDNKYFYLDKDVEKPLYLYNYIKNNNIKEVYVVESQINALTLYGYGLNAVATFGCGLTNNQINIFNRSGIIHYIMAFDGDDAGIKGTIKFIKNINKNVFIDVLLLPKNKDINDLTREEFNNLQIISSQEFLLQHKNFC